MEGGWTYSRACVDILREYQARFPDLFDYIAANSGNNNNASNDMFHELDVFEEEVAADKVRELITWLGRTRMCMCFSTVLWIRIRIQNTYRYRIRIQIGKYRMN